MVVGAFTRMGTVAVIIPLEFVQTKVQVQLKSYLPAIKLWWFRGAGARGSWARVTQTFKMYPSQFCTVSTMSW